ncbi:MAG: hypothetical protein R3C10_01385 [Pirellulales bacterium]|nr:hypothetical protein [Planctomycetales bacterium]
MIDAEASGMGAGGIGAASPPSVAVAPPPQLVQPPPQLSHEAQLSQPPQQLSHPPQLDLQQLFLHLKRPNRSKPQ